ncbi:hypothetical protein ACWIGM_05110 [Bosea sp. NPDC055332]
MLTKEQDGKLTMLTVVFNLPIQLVLAWYFIRADSLVSALHPLLAAVLLIVLSVPSFLYIRAKLRRRLYPNEKEGS